MLPSMQDETQPQPKSSPHRKSNHHVRPAVRAFLTCFAFRHFLVSSSTEERPDSAASKTFDKALPCVSLLLQPSRPSCAAQLYFLIVGSLPSGPRQSLVIQSHTIEIRSCPCLTQCAKQKIPEIPWNLHQCGVSCVSFVRPSLRIRSRGASNICLDDDIIGESDFLRIFFC
jgi:hypothetical protein